MKEFKSSNHFPSTYQAFCIAVHFRFFFFFLGQKRKEQKENSHARYSPDIVDFAHDAGTPSENPTAIVRDSGVCFQPTRPNYVRNLLSRC